MGLIAFGKLESGRITKGMKAIVMPDRKVVVIESLTHQDKEVRSIFADFFVLLFPDVYSCLHFWFINNMLDLEYFSVDIKLLFLSWHLAHLFVAGGPRSLRWQRQVQA